jgi:hypothetical protein
MLVRIRWLVKCRPVTLKPTTSLDTRSIVANLSNAGRDSVGEELSPIFSNKPLHLFAQSNQYLFKASGSSWHGGNSTHEYVNYFIRHGGQIGNRLVDPTRAVPTFEEIYEPLKSTHARLFAVWLGMNKHKLLVPDEKEAQPAIEAWMLRPERRLFVSTPMFAISVGILSLYTLVAVIVYPTDADLHGCSDYLVRCQLGGTRYEEYIATQREGANEVARGSRSTLWLWELRRRRGRSSAHWN